MLGQLVTLLALASAGLAAPTIDISIHETRIADSGVAAKEPRLAAGIHDQGPRPFDDDGPPRICWMLCFPAERPCPENFEVRRPWPHFH